MPDQGGPDVRATEASLSPIRGNSAADESARRPLPAQTAPPELSEAAYAALVAQVEWVTPYADRFLKLNEACTGDLRKSVKLLTGFGLALAALPPLAWFLAPLMGDPERFAGLKVFGLLPFEIAGAIILMSAYWRTLVIARENGKHMSVCAWVTALVVGLKTRRMDHVSDVVKRLSELDPNRVLSSGQTTEEIEANRLVARTFADGVAMFGGNRQSKPGKPPRGDTTPPAAKPSGTAATVPKATSKS